MFKEMRLPSERNRYRSIAGDTVLAACLGGPMSLGGGCSSAPQALKCITGNGACVILRFGVRSRPPTHCSSKRLREQKGKVKQQKNEKTVMLKHLGGFHSPESSGSCGFQLSEQAKLNSQVKRTVTDFIR